MLSELMLSYKLHADEYYRNSPKELERITLAMRPLREMYGLLPINEFGPVALKAVRQKMLTMQRRTIAVRDEKGIKIGERVREYRLSRRTINQRIDTLKRMFRWGVENEMVPPNVWHGLQAVKGLMQGRSDAVEPRKVTPVSTSEVEAVLPYVSRQVRGMIEIQRLTGARSGEICVLRPIDIDRTGKVWM